MIAKKPIPRLLASRIRDYLAIFPAVVLVGPRQTGKTTLARAIADSGTGGRGGGCREDSTTASRYLDLEDPFDRAKLADARPYLLGQAGRLTVLDEIHRTPGLFPVLRGVIDERIRGGEDSGQFLLLGSASLELLQQAGETLAGRVGTVELGPLDVREVERKHETTLWIRGGFPRSFLAESDRVSGVWRGEFVSTYLERDVPQFGPRIPAETLRRFWTMLAHAQGSIWNAARFARSLAIDGKTVARYLDLMVDLLLARRLPPLHANVRKRLVKSPKIYLRDSGLVHSLLRLDDQETVLGHPGAGLSWEGFVIENLLRAAPRRTEASFYRTATGVEVDLVLDLPHGERWAVEIKRGRARASRGLRVAVEDIRADRTFVLHGGGDRFSLSDGIEAVAVRDLAEELATRE